MPAPLSAIEAISPAFAQTKQQLFQPFGFWRWARLAVVSLVTGEFVGGSWSGAGNVSLPAPSGGGGPPPEEPLWLADPSWQQMQELLPWILLGVLALMGLALVWIYVASVFRFILFDAVLTGRYELGTGWRRWQDPGSRYFLWQIGFGLATLVSLALVVALPVFLAWRVGVFRQPDRHFVLLLVGGLLLFFLLMGLVLVSEVVALFAKDFVVPFMALENLGVLEAWRRVLPLLKLEAKACVGYVLMKIVLAVGSAILFGIINVILLLVLLLPLGALGVAAVLAAKAAGLSWNVYTIAAVVLLGLVALFGLLWAMSFVSSPAMFFFQSYTLHFLGGRYPVLGGLLWRSPLSTSAAAPTPGS